MSAEILMLIRYVLSICKMSMVWGRGFIGWSVVIIRQVTVGDCLAAILLL